MPKSIGIIVKAREFQKDIYLCFTDYTKAFVWITTIWKILQEMEIPGHLSCLLRNLYAGQEATVRTRHRTTDDSKMGKEYIKAINYHPVYLTSMQNASCEMLAWMKHKLESRFQGEISITSHIQMTAPLWQKVKKN